jgi:hypothetical protein
MYSTFYSPSDLDDVTIVSDTSDGVVDMETSGEEDGSDIDCELESAPSIYSYSSSRDGPHLLR